MTMKKQKRAARVAAMPRSTPRRYIDIHRLNARLAFNDLILSLTGPDHHWTTSERYNFNRVGKFLED